MEKKILNNLEDKQYFGQPYYHTVINSNIALEANSYKDRKQYEEERKQFHQSAVSLYEGYYYNKALDVFNKEKEKQNSYDRFIKSPSMQKLAKDLQPMTGKEKFHKVLHEFKEGTLTDGHGNKVKNRNQAIAIAYSEARSVEPGYGSNPISLEKVKEIYIFVDEERTANRDIFSGEDKPKKFNITPEEWTKIVTGYEYGKSPEEIWEEIHFKEENQKELPFDKYWSDVLKKGNKLYYNKEYSDYTWAKKFTKGDSIKLIKKAGINDIQWQVETDDGLLIYLFPTDIVSHFQLQPIKKSSNPEEYWNSLNKAGRLLLIEKVKPGYSQYLQVQHLKWSDLPEDIQQKIVGKNLEKMAGKRKLQDHIEANKPKKLQKEASKKTIEEEFEEEEEIKEVRQLTDKDDNSGLDVKESFIEDRNMFVGLKKEAYQKLAINEFKEFGQKMPFGHIRPVVDKLYVFYFSDKLIDFLNKYKINYVLYEDNKELIEELNKLI